MPALCKWPHVATFLVTFAAGGGYTAATAQTNTDVVTATNNAVIFTVKALSRTSGPSPNSNLTISLTYTNTGALTAANVTLTDLIGSGATAGMSYVPASGLWSRSGSALTDAAGGDPAGIAYDFNATTPNTVRAVIGSVAPGQSGTLSFRVDINAELPPGSATTQNTAYLCYNNGAALVPAACTGAPGNSQPTSTVQYTVIATPGSPDLTITKTHSGNFTVGRPGTRTLRVRNIGGAPTSGPNERGMRSISVTVPDRLGRIEIHLPETPIADGHTALPAALRLTDAKGVPITVRTPLTEATAVRWQVEDLDPREPGVQVFIDGGKAEYRLLPPYLFESNKRVAALGGDYQFSTRGRVYARHELISSLSSPFALNQLQENHNTVIGIDTEYLKDANLFSEYRARDAFDGRSSGAAIGTRNAWHLFEGLTLHTSAEQVKALESAGTGFDSDSQAYTGALEYTGHPLWKASGRVEYYHASNAESWLNTLGLAHKLDRDWTFLGRNILALTDSEGAAGASLQHRLQLGVAYRDTETNVWNALARYERKYEDGSPRVGFGLNTTDPVLDLQRTVDAVSLHYSYQPERSWVLSGRIAAKYVQEDSFGIKSGYDAELLMGRFTMDLTERWDLGVQASVLGGDLFRSLQFGVGPEAGYRVAENLWGSVGYNLFGFEDPDLSADEHTDQGPYVRLRFKFDEEIFKPVMDLLN